MDIIAFNRADTIFKRLAAINTDINSIQELLLIDRLEVRISASSCSLLFYLGYSTKDIKEFLKIIHTNLTTEEAELKKELAAL